MRGFTLIELLVAIAIIGILAAVVLASLSSVKPHTRDAAIKADLATIQTQAVLYYGIGNTYCATCGHIHSSCSLAGTVFNDTTSPVDATIKNAVANATANAGGSSKLVCHVDSQEFAVAAKLSTGSWWCVDRTGTTTGERSGPPSASRTDCSY